MSAAHDDSPAGPDTSAPSNEPVLEHSPPASKPIPAGWYPDPIEPDVTRYWDGEQWVDQQPATAALSEQVVPPGGLSAAQTSAPDYLGAARPAQTAAAQAPATAGPRTVGSGAKMAALAPLHWRLGARAIDFGVLLLLNAAVNGWFIYQYVRELIPVIERASSVYARTGNMPNVEISDRAQRLSLIITAIMMLLWLAYELPSTINTGQTFGKRILGVTVVDLATGNKPRLGQALRRWLIFALPLVFPPICAAPIMAIGAAWCLWDRPARQSLHDKFAHTIVVRSGSISAISPSDRTGGH